MKAKKELNVQIGKRIQKARQEAGMTQAALAEKLDVNVQYISDLERGVVGTSIQTLISICSILRVSSDSILFGTADLPPQGVFQHLDKLSLNEYRIVESAVELMLEALNLGSQSKLSTFDDETK